jgi:hypothetical protein
MYKNSFLFIFFILIISCKKNITSNTENFKTVFEKSNGLETATYEQTIAYYQKLAATFSEITIQSIGETDAGIPLHIVTFNPNGEFDFNKIRKNKRIILINNGIHPGESDGIDATMLLFRDIVQGKIKTPNNTVLVTIPIYNIGGSLNRNSTTRTNQNGPISYGFRGNARNYDLNRDFIKTDTKNAQTFTEIFHLVQPDVFIDNHVSNGADYQYTLTHLFTQHNKLGGEIGHYLHTEMMPNLEQKLNLKNLDITPYVNVFNSVPEKGFSQFMDSPRYSTGYTTLYNTLGMMVETHMLKPYKQRVEGTYELMKCMIKVTEEQGDKITQLRKSAFKNNPLNSKYTIQWKVDTTQTSTLSFKGYEGTYIKSSTTGKQRLKYDTSKPYTKNVTYQNYFTSKKNVSVPKAYLIPREWQSVITRLKANKIDFTTLKKDSLFAVESYRIANYETLKNPYEGHYLHYNTQVNKQSEKLKFNKGDILVYTNQKGFRYLIETLEPEAPDSFFNWNFFDTILQQKEHFSPYVWEDKSLELLKSNPTLKTEFEAKKTADINFKENWFAQLDWIHKQSKNYEKAHLQYPIYRLMEY